MTDGTLTGDRKADFTDIYRAPDPRGYFHALRPLGYQVPRHAAPVVDAVLAASARNGRTRTVLDVCCSYGINAALLRHDVGLEDLSLRYTDSALASLTSGQMVDLDRAYFARALRPDAPRVLGLDVSEPAIEYGVRTGVMRWGWAEDLESDEPSPWLRSGIADVGLVVCTGGVGYIGERTFGGLLDCVRNPGDLWLVVFVLRVFPYDRVAATLAEYGLVTERLPGTFPQRRFADREEQDAAVHDVELLGLDPAGKEADGWYHADCYVTRPAAVAAREPIGDLVP